MVRHVINEIICYMGHKTTKNGSIMTLIAQHSIFLILVKLTSQRRNKGVTYNDLPIANSKKSE